ncbi:MAG TPA: ribulose-phosphate 3-epimerase, partial [Eubacteriales bacterium]|nr:ribulose-phosphate 3-epimerase [Eubacteriales bacterium]
MGVYAGFGGQKFIPETLAKLAAAKKLIERSGRNIELEIDGGVTESNIGEILAAGADVIVAGSAVFKSADPAKTVASLRG